MANEIKDKFSSSAGLVISLASLATSTVGVGRQSDIVDNTTAKYPKVIIYIRVRQGTSPTGNKGVYLYGLRGDGVLRTDGAAASDAALTVLNAPLLGVMINKASPSTGDYVYGEFVFENPGPYWGIAVVHDTGVNLSSTESDHDYNYVGVLPEIQ